VEDKMVTAEWLKRTELFESLEEIQVNAILSCARVESCPEGRIIFQEGEEATHLYILIQGTIDLTVKAQEKIGFMTSQVEKEGGVFGVPALLEPYRYNVTAKCLVPSKVLKIEADHLKKRMEEDPRAGMMIMKKLALIYFNRLNELRKGVVNFFKVFPLKKP
jgi:CRP/FNR family transcriptional regulator, cyclic AMP receptor protein